MDTQGPPSDAVQPTQPVGPPLELELAAVLLADELEAVLLAEELELETWLPALLDPLTALLVPLAPELIADMPPAPPPPPVP